MGSSHGLNGLATVKRRHVCVWGGGGGCVTVPLIFVCVGVFSLTLVTYHFDFTFVSAVNMLSLTLTKQYCFNFKPFCKKTLTPVRVVKKCELSTPFPSRLQGCYERVLVGQVSSAVLARRACVISEECLNEELLITRPLTSAPCSVNSQLVTPD